MVKNNTPLKVFISCIVLLLAGVACKSTQRLTINQSIELQLREMEAGVNEKQPKRIMALYSDDGFVIGPTRMHAQGRKELDAYWADLGSKSEHWRLESFVIEQDYKSFLQSAAWIALEKKPRLPEDLKIRIDEKDKMVYQLGRSHLTFNVDGKKHVSVVDFLLIWKKVNGKYQIFVDSYQ